MVRNRFFAIAELYPKYSAHSESSCLRKSLRLAFPIPLVEQQTFDLVPLVLQMNPEV